MYRIKKWNSIIYFGRDLPLTFNDYYHHLMNKQSWWYKKKYYPTMQIQLWHGGKELLSQYSHGLRQDINRSIRSGIKVNYSNYSLSGIEVMKKVALAHPDLMDSPPEWILRKQENKFYSTAHHPKLGIVAAHLHLVDVEEKIALLLINASDFRSFDERQERAEVGRANKLLFHSDFLYFKKMGLELYDMGGYTKEVKSFKKNFGGNIVDTFFYEPYVFYYLRKLKNLIS